MTILASDGNSANGPEGLFIGVGDVGFSVASGTFAMAILKPPAPAQNQTADPRSWTAISATMNNATLGGVDAFSLTAQTLKLEINQSAGATPLPDALNWDTALRFGDSGSFGTTDLSVSGVEFKQSGRLLRVSGTMTMNIAGFVYAAGSFALEKGDNIFITPVGETATREVTLMRIGVSGGKLFAGVGGPPDFNDLDNTTAIGVAMTGVTFGIALMKEVTPSGASPASYTAFKGGGSARLVGIPSITLKGSIQVEVNTASDADFATPALPPVVDFTKLAGGKLDVPTGPNANDPKVTLNFGKRTLRATGNVTVAIDSFVFLTADFAFEKVDNAFAVQTEGGSPTSGQVTALKIGASNGYAFFGVDGPYWDMDGDGDVDAADAALRPNSPAMGLAVGNVSVALALMKPANGTFTAYKSFMAVRATGDVSLVGISAFEASITDAVIELNDASPVVANQTLPALNLTTAPGGKITVATGPASSQDLAFTGRILKASGYVTLKIDEFVFLAGKLGFERSTVSGMTVFGGGAAGDLTVIKVSAENVNIFAGIGGPYWQDTNANKMIDGGDTPAAAGATGLALSGVNIGLVLAKPTTVGNATPSSKSYFALSATAATIELVGVNGVTAVVTNLTVEINSSSDKNAPSTPPPVLNFQQTPMTVGSRTINFGTRLLRVHAEIDLTISSVLLEATIDFEQTTRVNNTKVIKIALTQVAFKIGDPADPTINISGAQGLIFITNLGMAAEFKVPVTLGSQGGDFFFQGDLKVGINNTNQAVNEEFRVDGIGSDGVDNDGDGQIDEAGEALKLVLPAGPYLRVAGTGITVQILGKSVTGDFQFETITRADNSKVTRIGLLNVSVSFTDPTHGGLTLTNGRGAFVLYPPAVGGGGVAGQLQGTFRITASGADFQAQATVILQVNSTTATATETITMENGQISFSIAAKSFSVTIRDLDVRVGDFFTLRGDFTTQTINDVNGERVIYGATNVTLFMGEGPYLLENDQVNPNAVGVVVKNAKVGVVKFTQGTADTADDKFAIYGWGQAELIGLGAILNITGTLRIRYNGTGKAVNEIINLPGTPAATIPVQFASSTFVEVFEVGVDANGNPSPGSKLVIDVGGVFVIDGSFRFTKLPSGRLDVEALTASVAVNIPTAGGQLIEGFKLSGAVRFAMGGGMGFQMINFRVSGFAIAGVPIANAIPAPASQLKPVEADLASPFAGSNIRATDFEQGGIFSDGPGMAHIDVLFKDTNFVGIKAETIIDGAEEFVIGGTGAANVIVNGAGVQIDPSNPNLFRYRLTKANNNLPFFQADPNDPRRGTVEVTFLENRFTDNQGASNGFDVEVFYAFIPSQQGGFGVQSTSNDPGPVPTAMLLSPFNGSTVNAKTLNAKPWIDVLYIPGAPGTKVIGIDGVKEVRITGPGASNVATEKVNNVSTGFLIGTPTEVAPNVYRYALTPISAQQPLFGNGQVNVEFVAVVPNTTTPTWCAVPLSDSSTSCDQTTTNPGKALATFTVDSTTINTAAAPAPTAIGPLTIDGLTVGLASTTFKGGKLVLTVGIEANEAALAFGGTAGAGNQTASVSRPS